MIKDKTDLIHYSINGEGQTVILFNGQFMDAESWEPIVEDLQRFYRVITFDFPNQGHTFLSADYDTIEDYCLFFIQLAEKLNINICEAIAVGFSFGGNVIKLLVLKYKLEFKAIVMGGVGPIHKNINHSSYDKIISQILNGNIAEFARGFYHSIFSDENRPSEIALELASKKFEQKYRPNPHALVALIKTAENMWESLMGMIERYSSDVYLLSARYDNKYVDFDIVEEYAKSINASNFILNCGHAMVTEDPFGVISALHTILEKYDIEEDRYGY